MTLDPDPHPGELLARLTADFAQFVSIRDAGEKALARIFPDLDHAERLRRQANARRICAELSALHPQLRRLEGARAFRKWTADLRR